MKYISVLLIIVDILLVTYAVFFQEDWAAATFFLVLLWMNMEWLADEKSAEVQK